jgi:hypothetical protein
MAMKQFVAMSDDDLYRAEGPPGPLVPYQCGVFCWHQLQEEVKSASVPGILQAAAPVRSGEGLTVSA